VLGDGVLLDPLVRLQAPLDDRPAKLAGYELGARLTLSPLWFASCGSPLDGRMESNLAVNGNRSELDFPQFADKRLCHKS